MSTFFSLPSLSFFTLTLQPGRASTAAKAKVKPRRGLMSNGLSVGMLRSFLRDLWRTLDPGTSLGDVGNADWQMAANGDLAKERFDRADFRNAGVGKSAKVVLYCGEILSHVRISHSEHNGFLCRVVEYRL